MADNLAVRDASGTTRSKRATEISTDILTEHVVPADTTGVAYSASNPYAVKLYLGTVAVSTGAGAVGTGVPRTTLASDDPAVASLAIIDDWDESDRAKVNPIVGVAGVAAGSGVVGTTTQRMVLATDVGLPAGESFLGTTGEAGTVIDLTLSLDTGGAYAANDLLADTQTLTNVARVNGGQVTLQSVQLLDLDEQSQSIDLIFLDTNVSMGTENSAPSISDANAANILGSVYLLAANYFDIGGSTYCTKSAIDLRLKAGSSTKDLYIAAVVRTGTPTYTASGIKLKLGFKQH